MDLQHDLDNERALEVTLALIKLATNKIITLPLGNPVGSHFGINQDYIPPNYCSSNLQQQVNQNMDTKCSQ